MCYEKKIQIKSRIWVQKGEYAFLGQGRIRLLKMVKETGSLSKASKKLGMSYKKAWDALESMNKSSKHKVVKSTTGGKTGGSTILTKYGEELIERFDELLSQTHQFLEEKEKELIMKLENEKHLQI